MSKKAVFIIILLLSLIAADSGCTKQQETQNDIELRQAVRSGDTPEVARLLAAGANIHAKDNNGNTPLHKAAMNCRMAAAKLLITEGANVNAKNKGGKNPIFPAAKGGSLELVKLLVDNGSRIPKKGLTPLYAAAGGHFLSSQNIEKRRTALVRFFLDRGVDVNAKCNTMSGAETTVLHAAAMFARTAVMQLLIEKGAQVNAKGKGGQTPLFSAALAGNKEAAEVLIKSGANVNEKNNRQCTALHYAVQMNNLVSYATPQDRIEFVELLFAHGADVNAANGSSYTPLHCAVAWGWPNSPEHKAIIQALLAKGANPNTKDRYGRTPLHLARGNPEIVTLLRKYGSDRSIFPDQPGEDNKFELTQELFVSYESRNAIIDLDINKTWGPAAQGSPTDYPEVDIYANIWADTHGQYTGLSHNMLKIMPQKNGWDITATNLVKRIETVPSAENKVTRLADERDETPKTFLFQTRESRIGVLQILGFTKNPNGVKIRYKMVEKLAVQVEEGNWNAKPDLSPHFIDQLNTLLANSDAQIRSGLVELAKKYPQLKEAEEWKPISKRSEAGSISIEIEKPLPERKVSIGSPPKDFVYLRVFVTPGPNKYCEQLGGMQLFWRNLGLVGSTVANAGDPKLDAALKKLVEDAVELLDELEGRQAKIKEHYLKYPIALAVELATINNIDTYHQGQSIVVEARLKNTSGKPQIYPGGFGMTSMKWCCQVELTTPDGKAWAAEAEPFQQFCNYKDIDVKAGESLAVGRWDLSQLEYNAGYVFRTIGDKERTQFSEICRPGNYLVRWWDGMFQGRGPLVSQRVEFSIQDSRENRCRNAPVRRFTPKHYNLSRENFLRQRVLRARRARLYIVCL